MVLLVLLMMPSTSRAVVVDWLYQVRTPVEDQSSAGRTEAARTALRLMLTRISGVVDLPLSPILQAAERSPERYFGSFQYLRDTDSGALAVQFTFEPALTLKLAKALALPVWWQNRPRVVPWLALDEAALVMAPDVAVADPMTAAGTPEAESDRPVDATAAIAAGLLRRARERGLPLALPTPDNNGLEPIAPERVARVDALELLAASTGLNAEWLGQGRIESQPAGFRAALRFTPAELGAASAPPSVGSAAAGAVDDVLFNVSAATASELGAQIADRLADALAQRFAATGGGALALRVVGVEDAVALVGLLKYLRSLSFLDAVQIVEASPDGLLLQLQSQADFVQLQSLLAVDAQLQPEQGEGAVVSFGAPIFRWQG